MNGTWGNLRQLVGQTLGNSGGVLQSLQWQMQQQTDNMTSTNAYIGPPSLTYAPPILLVPARSNLEWLDKRINEIRVAL